MNKKFISTVLAVAMVFSLICIPSFATSNATFVVVGDNNGDIKTGDILTATVVVPKATAAIVSGATTIEFNKDVLTVTEINFEKSDYQAKFPLSDATNVSSANSNGYAKASITAFGSPAEMDTDLEFSVKFSVNATARGYYSDLISVDTSAENYYYKDADDNFVGTMPTFDTTTFSATLVTEVTGTQNVSIVTPVRGATPQSTIAAGTGYTGAIAWEGNPTKFVSNTVYSANITLTASEGYKFGTSATGSVAGATVSNINVSADGRTLTFKATFPATADKDLPTCDAPTGLTATYGDTLANVTLSNPSGNTEGTWSWMTPSTPVGDVSNSKNFKAKFVPTDTLNYATVENIDVPVTVNPKSIEVAIASISDQEYTGSQIKPAVTVMGDSKTLVLDTDYTVEYGENVNVGTGSVTVKAKTGGNYTFTNTNKNFNIVRKAGTISISGNLDVTYGTVVPNVTVNKNGSDGTVTVYYYTNSACTEGKTATKPTDAGNYWVQAEMAAGTNYGAAFSNVLSFTIFRANITPVVDITGWTYKDSANSPSVTENTGNGDVTYKYKLKSANDSTYTTTVPTNAGEYTVKAEIAQTANHNAGSATTDFTIVPKVITEAMIASVSSQAYTGSEIKPTPAVTDGTVLVNNTDFTYAYESNTYVGTTAEVKVTGKGNYTGTASKTFSITAVNQTPAITSTASVTKGGNTVDLKPLVVNAKGIVSFEISGDAKGCTLDNGVLASGSDACTVKINVAITAKDEGGDVANEYNAYSQAEAITVTVNDKETQASLNITSATNVTYGQTLTLTSDGGSGTGTVTYAVTNGTGEATIVGNVLTPTKVGTVTVIATKAEDATYNSISSAPVVITIDKIKVAIPAVDTTVYTYTGTEQTYQIADNTAYTVVGNKQTAANEIGYPITVTLNDTTTHAWTDDTIEVKNYTFIINKATITISAKNKSAYIGDTTPVLGTEDYTVTGLKVGEVLKTLPTIAYEIAPDMTQAGAATIKVSGAEAPDGGNYKEIVYNDGTLTISRRSSGGGGGGTSSYTIKFETNGGNTVKSQSVSKNKTVTEPTAPTKDGYTFDGWYTDAELTISYDFDTKVTKSFKLYAKWTENKTEEKSDETDRTETPDAEVIPFTDVDTDDWYYETVKTAYEKGLIKGISDTKFGADTNVTRGMFVTVLYRMEGEPAVNKSIPFADVNAEDYYSNAISWAEQNNIVAGISDTMFAPNDNITREQMATILFRYATYKGMDTVNLAENLGQFTDNSEILEYAISALNWAVGSNVMSGKGNEILDPKGFATRAEAAAVLVRMAK